jgi:hypothetical protein
MGNPRTTAIISGIAVLLLGYRIFFSSEGVNPTLAILQWVLFIAALVGLVGSIIQMNKK